MNTSQRLRAAIAEVSMEQALMIGGMVALHHVDDAFVWELARGLDHVRSRALSRIDDTEADAPPSEVGSAADRHPAIAFLLSKITEAS